MWWSWSVECLTYFFSLLDKVFPWQPHCCLSLVGDTTSSFDAIQMKPGTHNDLKLKVLWNTNKIVFSIYILKKKHLTKQLEVNFFSATYICFCQILQRKSSHMKFTAFSKQKKNLGQPNSPCPQKKISKTILEYHVTIWRHYKNDPIIASSISPCRTYSPIGFLYEEFHAVLLLIRDLINSSWEFLCRLDEQPAKCQHIVLRLLAVPIQQRKA